MRHDGYPDRHWDVVRRATGCSLVAAAVALAIAVVSWFLAVEWDAPVLPAAVAAAVFLIVAGCATATMIVVRREVAIHPYFESRVGEIDTFGQGRELARHLKDLDELARELGVVPLSAFGFADDLAGEALTWHDAATGRKTAEALLVVLSGDGLLAVGSDRLVQDPKRLAHALGRADDRGIRFCLLLRHGDGTSAQEWEVRKGSAF